MLIWSPKDKAVAIFGAFVAAIMISEAMRSIDVFLTIVVPVNLTVPVWYESDVTSEN